jgi:hypothetical protein
LHITEHQYPRYGVIDTPEQRHALAALALHGQPFGFTQEDVIRLHGLAHHMQAETGDRPYTDKIQDLAHRIAALLPPIK